MTKYGVTPHAIADYSTKADMHVFVLRIAVLVFATFRGPVAQLGERHNGIVEARGSIPLRSKIFIFMNWAAVMEWQTCRSQKPVGLAAHVGSTPTSGTKFVLGKCGVSP